MKNSQHVLVDTILCLLLLLLVVACGPTASDAQTQPAGPVNKNFQSSITPIPTVAKYRCGAWTSNNSPNAFGFITVYARLTQNLAGVGGAPARGVVHFQTGDAPLEQQPVSDAGGYVSFTLPLEGRQPPGVPTTIDVSFSVSGQMVQCSQAFFTPL